MSSLVPVHPGQDQDIDNTLTLAKVFAESRCFSDTHEMTQACVKIQAGRELGFGPVQSMTGIYLVKGKISISANLMAAAVRRHPRYDYQVRHLDEQKCVIEYTMDKQPIGVSAFTMDDAKKAGLANGDNWRKYPRNMLFARAMSNGARWFCPDVFGGPVYTPDELGATIDAEEGTVIEVKEVKNVVDVKPTISHEQLVQLEDLIYRKGADTAKLLSHYGVQSLTDLSPEQFDTAISLLRNKPDVSKEPQSGIPESENNTIMENENV